MVTVRANGTVIASSSSTEQVEGNHYFPPGDIVGKYFKPSAKNTTSHCGWKGDCSYYDITLDDGTVIADGAWYYPNTLAAAKHVEGYVAFYKNKVQIEG